MAVFEGPLGRREPSDWEHVERYPIRALTAPERPIGVPVVIGVPWYTEFDHPVKGRDGRWRVATDGRLTRVRGGHCVCLLPKDVTDRVSWWLFYNQGQEGACVGFGCSRCQSLLNRKRYDARWLYQTAQYGDEYANTPPEEGTSVRAGFDTMRQLGLKIVHGKNTSEALAAEGISANRWATNMQDVLTTLGRSNATEIPWLNSWGLRGYPHTVWVPVAVHERLESQGAEYGIVTDR